jgi:2'-5' RNA ligase
LTERQRWVVAVRISDSFQTTIAEMVGFQVDGMPPFRLSLAGAGAFPDVINPRVIRLDLAGDTPGLELLQDRIERGGEAIGFPPEGRPFHPHITLGRVREGHRLPPGAMERLEGIAPHDPFVADRVVLFESELGSAGPTYRARAEWPLR